MKTSERILKFIIDHRNEHGYAPTVREIGEAVGLQSSSSVAGHLDRLEKAGKIKRKPASARAIEVIEDGKADKTDRGGAAGSWRAGVHREPGDGV